MRVEGEESDNDHHSQKRKLTRNEHQYCFLKRKGQINNLIFFSSDEDRYNFFLKTYSVALLGGVNEEYDKINELHRQSKRIDCIDESAVGVNDG